MNKNYKKPKIVIKMLKDDVIRTSAPGIANFNPDWLSGTNREECNS